MRVEKVLALRRTAIRNFLPGRSGYRVRLRWTPAESALGTRTSTTTLNDGLGTTTTMPRGGVDFCIFTAFGILSIRQIHMFRIGLL
jgi:hypothetical protein